MEANLKFTLPEEASEFKQAVKGVDAHLALFVIAQEIFRPARKHGYHDRSIQILLEKLDGLVETLHSEGKLPENWPTDEYGPENASDLIGKLEKMFYETTTEYQLEID